MTVVSSKCKYEKINRRRKRSADYAELDHFTFLYPKIYNARVQLLFYSLNLLFDDVLVAVVVVVCLNSLVNAHFMVPAISQRSESGCKNVRGLGKHKGSILFVRCFCSGSFRKSWTSLIVIYNGKKFWAEKTHQKKETGLTIYLTSTNGETYTEYY